jgi:hypothetical protein
MTDDWVGVEALATAMEERAVEQDADDCRLIAFFESVGDVEGPVGELLRQVAHAYSQYQVARENYGTTEGEAVRLGWVLADAMALVESMRDGDQVR